MVHTPPLPNLVLFLREETAPARPLQFSLSENCRWSNHPTPGRKPDKNNVQDTNTIGLFQYNNMVRIKQQDDQAKLGSCQLKFKWVTIGAVMALLVVSLLQSLSLYSTPLNLDNQTQPLRGGSTVAATDQPGCSLSITSDKRQLLSS